jgi:predicted dehydrogenase
MTGPVRVGILGAGNVCDHYLPRLTTYPDIELMMIGDRHPERAADRASTFGIPRTGTVDEVIAADGIEAVVNLTPPAVHIDTSLQAIAAGKHVYSEKPLALDARDARRLTEAAKDAGVVLGSAPDVTLAPGFQAALRFLQSGDIGAPVFARCEAVLAGPEVWHPRPQFLYARGGGPLFDIGPYYLTALVAALGPVRSVTARGTRKAQRRVIGSGPSAGEDFPVEVPTLVAAVLELVSGVTATLLLTFDSATHRGGWMEVLGETGTLRTPDPNGATADPSVLRGDEWEPISWVGEFAALAPGVVNFARHIRGTEPLVADGVRGAHVVEVMEAIQSAGETGERILIASTVAPCPLLPEGWSPVASTLIHS